jgi:hypothetical protein
MYTGALRVQLLPDGIGTMIDMVRPPTQAQVDAIHNYYTLTGGNTFVVEVNYNGELLAWLQSWPDFDHFIKNYKKKHTYKPLQTDIREFLKRQDMDEAWYGREYQARKRIVFA